MAALQCVGVFCRACVFLSPYQVGGHDPGQVVTKPFNTWEKMTTKAKSHARNEYHLGTMTKTSDRYENRGSYAADCREKSACDRILT